LGQECGNLRQGVITMKKLDDTGDRFALDSMRKGAGCCCSAVERADAYSGLSCNSLAAGHEALDSSRRQSGTRPAFS
jgi:hypothetical protein